jgi:(p)ppGpp synthase/HD superfamily hydrolase
VTIEANAAKKGGVEVTVPFTPGRVDATQEQTDAKSFAVLEPTADGFRNHFGAGQTRSPADALVEKAALLAGFGRDNIHVIATDECHAMRVDVQIKTREMHRINEFGLAAHWAYKQGGLPDGQVGWVRDLVEILEATHDPDELLEHTKMAIYQDRIFAFTPKGALFQLPKGATPIDFAFAVHTNLGALAVGAKINGRHVPLRTPLGNGDVVEIIKSRSSEPQLSWLAFVVTGKARAAIRRFVRMKERAEIAEIGRKLYEEIAERLPSKIGKKALGDAVKRLKMGTEEDLMFAIGSAKIDDRQVMEALVPGSAANLPASESWPSRQGAATSRAKARQPSATATGLISSAQPTSSPMAQSRPQPGRSSGRATPWMASAIAAVVKGAKSNSVFTDMPPGIRLWPA